MRIRRTEGRDREGKEGRVKRRKGVEEGRVGRRERNREGRYVSVEASAVHFNINHFANQPT